MTEQRWIDFLRLGPSLAPWSTQSTQSKPWQTLRKMRVPWGHTPSERCSTNNPDLICSTFNWFTNQGQCVCIGKAGSCLGEQAAMNTLRRDSKLGMAFLTVGTEPVSSMRRCPIPPAAAGAAIHRHPLCAPLPTTTFQRQGLKHGITEGKRTAPGEDMPQTSCQKATSSRVFWVYVP